MRKFENFSDSIIADYVIGDDVIGHPEIRTDNSWAGLYGIQNRLAINGLE